MPSWRRLLALHSIKPKEAEREELPKCTRCDPRRATRADFTPLYSEKAGAPRELLRALRDQPGVNVSNGLCLGGRVAVRNRGGLLLVPSV